MVGSHVVLCTDVRGTRDIPRSSSPSKRRAAYAPTADSGNAKRRCCNGLCWAEPREPGPLPPIGTAGDLEAASSTDGIGDMLPQAEEPISFHQAMEEANRRWIHVSDLDKIEGKMSITNMCGRGVGQQRMDECFAGKWRPAWFVSYIAEKNLRDLARQQGTCHAVAHQLLQRPALGRLSKHW